MELPLNLPTKNQKYISKKENISSQVTKERIEGLKGEIAALRREADKQWTFIQVLFTGLLATIGWIVYLMYHADKN